MTSGKNDGLLFKGTGSSFGVSRLAVAVGAGILIVLIWTYLYPLEFLPSSAPNYVSNALSHVSLQVLLSCEYAKQVKHLKTELHTLRLSNAKLRKQARELNWKVQQAEQIKHSDQKQLLALGAQVKAAPMGTAKSLRTNPTVLPDESINPKLAKLLRNVAVNQELIIGIANSNVKDMLQIWFEGIRRAGITNYLVVALDDPIVEFCKSNNVPVYRRNPNERILSYLQGDKHAVSALKFEILREFLQLGYSVLLSGIDIVYLQNPFHFLHRDCDVESMTDGYTDLQAYGYDDVFDDPAMGWGRYDHTIRVWAYNSEFLYIRPTIPSIELLDRVADRLFKEKAWDQAIFNEEIFFPSYPGYEGLHASRRTMDYHQFLNSKILFTRFRNDPKMASFKPVVVHINFHPDKLTIMKAVVEYYVQGKKEALDPFHGDSESFLREQPI